MWRITTQQGLRLTTNVEGGESWIKCEVFRIGAKATDGQSIEELAANKTHLYNVLKKFTYP